MNRIFYLPSFIKQLEKLRGDEAERVEEALTQFQRFVQSGEKEVGLGFKKIGPSHYEIRTDIHKRIAMKKYEDGFYLAIYGNHDDIEKFLSKQ